ncbi:MAG: hypothetical protein OEQ18_02150 [Gammaproteobacteria bacterium]|nr:hypothetical protein [Gammaproteobacteria bacterium]
MADQIEITFDNIKGFEEAARLAPKRVLAALKREFAREGKKFQTEYRKQNLFGGSGINLPARQATVSKRGKTSFKRRKNKEAVGTQLAHVKTKTISGKTGMVLVGYLSRFLTYHRSKLEGPFRAMFRGVAPRLTTRISKEAARITQAVLDKGLRDAQRGSR